MKPVLIFLVFTQLLTFGSRVFSHEGRPVVVDIIKSGRQVELRWRVPAVVPFGAEPVLQIEDCRVVVEPVPGLVGHGIYDCGVSHGANLLIRWPIVNPALTTIVKYRGDVSIYGPEVYSIKCDFGVSRLSPKVNLLSFFKAGIEHILAGLDHLLFVFAMTVLVSRIERQISRKYARKLIEVVTGFTFGHSITLFVSAMGWVNLPAPPVEAAIALSILFVSSELASDNRTTLTWKFPGTVAAAFGLLHGLGFASALNDVGLPEGQRLASLLAFNIGIELGQLAIVFVICVAIWLISRLLDRNYQKIGLFGFVYAVGITASFWFVERILLFY